MKKENSNNNEGERLEIADIKVLEDSEKRNLRLAIFNGFNALLGAAAAVFIPLTHNLAYDLAIKAFLCTSSYIAIDNANRFNKKRKKEKEKIELIKSL